MAASTSPHCSCIISVWQPIYELDWKSVCVGLMWKGNKNASLNVDSRSRQIASYLWCTWVAGDVRNWMLRRFFVVSCAGKLNIETMVVCCQHVFSLIFRRESGLRGMVACAEGQVWISSLLGFLKFFACSSSHVSTCPFTGSRGCCLHFPPPLKWKCLQN